MWNTIGCLLLIAILFIFGSCIIISIGECLSSLLSWLGITSKKSSINKQAYWDIESEIFKQCFDSQTTVFHWEIWFDRRDEIIHYAPADVLQYIDSEFRHCGTVQIYLINAIIENDILSTNPYNPTAGIRELKQSIVDTGIYTNLRLMFSSVNANFDYSQCPKEVRQYQEMLRDIIYGNGMPTRRMCEEAVRLGRLITS